MNTKSLFATTNLETYTPRILALSLLAVLLLLALTGCKNAASTTAGINPRGIYTLVSVDGKDVPCSLTHEGAKMAIKSGIFTINNDSTCRGLTTFSVPPYKDIHREVKANYTQKGAELTMRWAGAGTTKGSINGSTFTMNNEGMVLSYRREQYTYQPRFLL